MIARYRSKKKGESVQIISYLKPEEKVKVKQYCKANGLTITGLIRKELLEIINNNEQ